MSQFFRHARKLQNAQNILQHRLASTVYFSSDAAAAFVSREVGKGDAEASIDLACSLTTKASSTVLSISRLMRNTTKTSFLMPSLRFISVVPCPHAASVRYYSAHSDLPPHQEIGMASLSPTMIEGNIARWLC